ncbi:MAG: ATP-binding protein [Bacteroidales bacterium]|nr:ATP-binding protein [Bacteroidales bacterium]
MENYNISSKRRMLAVQVLDFSLIFILVLIGVTIEDHFHGVEPIESLLEWHHYLLPTINGIVGTILAFKLRTIRRREKSFVNENAKIIERITESESYFKTLMQQAPSVIEIYDLTGLQVDVNKAYERLWSFPASTTVNTFNVLQSKEVEKTGLLDYINRAYNGEYVTVPEYEFDPKGETESKGFGRKRWLSTRIFPLKDSKDNVKNIVITHEDISERKYAEEKILKAMEKAEESDKLKTMFLANLSHEIRTPMNGILGFADLLRQPDIESDKQHMYVDIIRKSGERMLNIINELIDISQIESGGVKLNNEEFDCCELLTDLYNFFNLEAENNGIQLLIKPLDEGNGKLCADKNRLSQILTNLLKNAFKFTNSGYIKIGCSKLKESMEFFVEDTGSGIAPDMQSKIFERFRQGDLTIEKAEEGLGLGLSITKSLIEIMGGKIKLKSELGTGSTFSFTIPNGDPGKDIYKQVELLYSMERFNIQKLAILIAEDDEISFTYFKELMKNTPNKLYFARTGRQAVHLALNTEELDIILMDLKMPEINGYDAIKTIRARNKVIPIIVQSAFASDLDIEQAIKSGANDFISKPIDSKKLISLIQKYTPEIAE